MSYTKTNWENLPSTNTPLNSTNLNKIETEVKLLDDNLTWTRIANFQTASSTSTVSISGITNYNEFLVSLTPTGSSERCLASITVPAVYFLGVADPRKSDNSN